MGDCKSFRRNIMFGDILRSTLAVPVFGTLHQNSALSTARIIHTNHMVHYTHKSQGAYTNARKTYVHANHVVRQRMQLFSPPLTCICMEKPNSGACPSKLTIPRFGSLK